MVQPQSGGGGMTVEYSPWPTADELQALGFDRPEQIAAHDRRIRRDEIRIIGERLRDSYAAHGFHATDVGRILDERLAEL